MRRALACLALVLAACGGGSIVVGGNGVVLSLVGFVDGFTVGPVSPGQPLSAVIRPGQSIEFDAGVPVSWSLTINGTPSSPSGTFVVGGVSITVTPVGGSRIAISTSLVTGAVAVPVTLALTALAADGRQAATATLQVR